MNKLENKNRQNRVPPSPPVALKNQEFTRITNKFTNNGKFVRIVLYWTLLDSKYKDLAKYHIIQYAGGLTVGAQRRTSIFRFRSARWGKSFGIAA